MFDGRWRSQIERGVKPVGTTLRRWGLSADHLTAIGLLTAAAAAVAIGNGALRAGFLLVILAGLPDIDLELVDSRLFDGRVQHLVYVPTVR